LEGGLFLATQLINRKKQASSPKENIAYWLRHFSSGGKSAKSLFYFLRDKKILLFKSLNI